MLMNVHFRSVYVFLVHKVSKAMNIFSLFLCVCIYTYTLIKTHIYVCIYRLLSIYVCMGLYLCIYSYILLFIYALDSNA